MIYMLSSSSNNKLHKSMLNIGGREELNHAQYIRNDNLPFKCLHPVKFMALFL